MAIKDIFSSVGKGVGRVNDSLSNIFGQTTRYTAPMVPKPASVPKSVKPERMVEALRYLESSGGLDPNTPRNQSRQYIIPAANANEQSRTIDYNSGFGGEYGLTPAALAELAKSNIDMNAPTSAYTKFGRPLIPGMDTRKIQEELMTVEGAGRLANEYFNRRRSTKDDWTPEALTKDYIENYMGKGTPNDTPENRRRVLEYFRSIME